MEAGSRLPAVDGGAAAQACVPMPWAAGLMRSGQVIT